jgi:hypothetical protein
VKIRGETMSENAYGPRYLTDDAANAAAERVLAMLSERGVDAGRIVPREDGTFGMQYADGTRMEFGRPAGGDAMTRAGWDWCAYGLDGEPDEMDWAPDDETLAGVLKSRGRDWAQG